MQYITWTTYDNSPLPIYRPAKVHLTKSEVTKEQIKIYAWNLSKTLPIKTLCGRKVSTIEPRLVKSWLGRPCLRCKAIQATQGTMIGYHTELAKLTDKSS